MALGPRRHARPQRRRPARARRPPRRRRPARRRPHARPRPNHRLGASNRLRAPPSDLGFAYASLLTEHPALDATGAHLTLASTRVSRRRSHGVFYTPDTIARGLLETALDPVERTPRALHDPRRACRRAAALRVCDPAAGSGQFLVAAAQRLADHLAEARADRTPPARLAALRDVVQHCIYAVDIDPFAAELCKIALWFACADPAMPLDALDDHIKVANALLGAPPRSLALEAANDWCRARTRRRTPPATKSYRARRPRYFHWHLAFPEVFGARPPADAGFNVVLGNPPFLSQLATATTHTRATASLLRARFDGVLSGYADTASAFLLLGAELLREGGRVALVQPQSVLGARDAAPVRRALLEHTSLVSLWVGNDRVFEGANVFTCAPTLERAPAGRAPVRRFATAAFTELDPLELDRKPNWRAPRPGPTSRPAPRASPPPPTNRTPPSPISPAPPPTSATSTTGSRGSCSTTNPTRRSTQAPTRRSSPPG
ncbi:MAG: DNA methyltransferase [Phycisphaerales bacterium]